MKWNARARGRRKPGEMNKTEAAYAEHLRALQLAGEIEWFAYEAMKFKLAKNTFYTPDFIVMLADGALEAHEVKGFWEDDARVKVKVASDTFPIRFVALKPISKKNGGGWCVEEF